MHISISERPACDDMDSSSLSSNSDVVLLAVIASAAE